MIVETIHVVNFDDISSKMASDHSVLTLPQLTTSNELELLYSPMFSELLNGTSHVVSKSSAVHAADNPDKRQQHNTTHTSTTTDVADPPSIEHSFNTSNSQSLYQLTPVQDQGETSSRHVESSNMHTFYLTPPSAQRWKKKIILFRTKSLEIILNQLEQDIARRETQMARCHGMTSCDSIGTPMATKHLDADLSGTPVDQTKYRSMVGALMYLTASRPDIVHATCYCARYQAKPSGKHLTAG
ncbi:hypothetical protein Tco_0194971 [Tanacetum coccineum]